MTFRFAPCLVCQHTNHIACEKCGGWVHGDGSHIGPCQVVEKPRRKKKAA